MNGDWARYGTYGARVKVSLNGGESLMTGGQSLSGCDQKVCAVVDVERWVRSWLRVGRPYAPQPVTDDPGDGVLNFARFWGFARGSLQCSDLSHAPRP
jgi:hypothetical protein